jgi:hypothetical protein
MTVRIDDPKLNAINTLQRGRRFVFLQRMNHYVKLRRVRLFGFNSLKR